MSSAGQPRTLAGRYRLDEVIGRSGMSTVYRGTDLALDRVVAVKVAMDPLIERDPVYAARFKREARAAAALSHLGVVTVYDAGADGPTRFIVMEYVRGRSLAEVLREQSPLEPARAAHVAERIADTLAAAHAAGIVHRDIKPGNVMIADDGSVRVLDFGIARTLDGGTLTQTASVLGTAPYMAPEQAMGQPADARSDIYSLGCVLYEMLTGEPPFMADLPAAVLHQHVRVAPKAASARNPAVPPVLDALVMEMLAKSPQDRPQTAAEVRDRLAAYAAATEADPTPDALIAAAAAAAAAAEVPQTATVSQAATPSAEATRIRGEATMIPREASAATRPLPPRRGPRAWPWALAAAIAALLAGGAVAFALSGGSGSSQSSSTPARSSSPATTQPAGTGSSTSRATSTPSTSSSSTKTTTTTTTTATTTPTTAATSTPTTKPGVPSVPPGQGGVPPGQAKKG